VSACGDAVYCRGKVPSQDDCHASSDAHQRASPPPAAVHTTSAPMSIRMQAGMPDAAADTLEASGARCQRCTDAVPYYVTVAAVSGGAYHTGVLCSDGDVVGVPTVLHHANADVWWVYSTCLVTCVLSVPCYCKPQAPTPDAAGACAHQADSGMPARAHC
jgi:hypothetical protein